MGLIYGSGFLVEFTYFKSFGITDIDFIRTKYIHIGCIFLLACLVIVFPLGWLIWFWRKEHADSFIRAARHGRLIKMSWIHSCKWFFDGSKIEKLHSTFPVIGTVSLMLWNFFVLVAFTDMDFARKYARLITFNFGLPLFSVLIAFAGDAFEKPTSMKNTSKDKNQARMKKLLKAFRLIFRIAALIIGLGIILPRCFLQPIFCETSEANIRFYNSTWQWMLILLFGIIFVSFLATIILPWKWPNKYSNSNWFKLNVRRWVLYAIQWSVFLFQVWVFAAIAEHLDVSLAAILFGKNWPGHWFEHIVKSHFPFGSVYFVCFMLVILFFGFRSTYRLKQIDNHNHQTFLLISTSAVIITLFYLSILCFSRFVFPYIPESRGGGDYTSKSPVEITFPTNSLAFGNVRGTIPEELISEIDARHTIILDQNSTFIFLAKTNDNGGPSSWRTEGTRPKVFEIRRDAILNISYTADKDTPSIPQTASPKPRGQMKFAQPQQSPPANKTLPPPVASKAKHTRNLPGSQPATRN